MIKTLNTFISQHSIKILILYAILIRLVLFATYHGVTIYPDSENYIDLANYLSGFSLENYTGERTPGFPALIALANNNLQITVLFQLVLGVLSTYLVYDFSKIKSKQINLSFWIAALYTSFFHVLFFEFSMLTEALSIFLVILSFWYIEKFQLLQKHTAIKHYIILSLILSWMYLTRPLFIYFPLGFFLFYSVKHFKLKYILKSTLVLILPFISYYAWNSLNEKNIGYFTNTYYFGINLSQTATSFFDKAPEKDKLIRDIFVKHRDSIAIYAPKKHPMSVWYAYDELLEKTKLNAPDLSNKLGKISIDLFKEYPELYIKQVAYSWYLFWNAPGLHWNAEKLSNTKIRGGISVLWTLILRHVVVIFNVLFIFFALKTLIAFFKNKLKPLDSDLFLLCIVLSGSISQALVAYGTNSRFSFPFFALIVYFVVSKLYALKRNVFSLKK